MNFIPAGTFVMGSPAAETGREADEVQHQVTLSRPFFMATTEVTQAEWTKLTGDLNYSCNQTGTQTGAACSSATTAGAANGNLPVEKLDWYAAVAYANAKSESEGLTPCYKYSVARAANSTWGDGDFVFSLVPPLGTFLPTLNCTGYRLPTEAESEYAARAGTTGATYNAANPLTPTQAELNLIAWNGNNAGGRTHDVGLLAANNWGLYDMLGNVYEYQWDINAAFTTAAVTDPLGGTGSSGSRVLRSGPYDWGLGAMRTANRHYRDPTLNDSGTLGLRLVRTAVLPVSQSACPTGYHVNTADNVCSPDVIACDVLPLPTNATAAAQTWNGTSYGACNVATACTSGFHLEAGACVSDTKSCNNTFGAGLQAWNGTTYGACLQPLGGLCSANSDCFFGLCATAPAGTANDRCAPIGMNYIPAGTFTMGSPTGEVGRNPDETPHSVTLSRRFFLGQTEVTQGQWKALSGATNPSCFQSTTNPSCTTSNANDSGPAEQIDWYAAVAFANARSAAEGLTSCYTLTGCTDAANGWQDGLHTGCTGATFAGLTCTGYRLPTESEWEYAARGGTTGATYNAANPLALTQAELNLIAWNFYNAGARIRMVGLKAANSLGLFDMMGNVWEWTGDWYGTYLGTLTDPLGAGAGSNRVFRGASWFDDARWQRAAARNFGPPSLRLSNTGFRLARTVP
jgi:formylglycine-generating enzyme required for sulfatase activity